MPDKNLNAAIQLNCSACWLKDISVFKDCPEIILDDLFNHKKLKSISKKSMLTREGEEFKGVFCIQKGVVKISKKGKLNKEFILWFAKPGDIIGLDSFINKECYNYSSSAVDDVDACFIPAKDFTTIIKRDPTVSIKLMKTLCEKISFIEDRITSIAQKKIREQFAEMLLLLAMRDNKTPENSVAINFTIKDLANAIGTTTNYLYKILSELANQNTVSLHNKKLVINNFEKLSSIAVGNDS